MSTCDSLQYITDDPILIVLICMGKSIRIQRVNQDISIIDKQFKIGERNLKMSLATLLFACMPKGYLYGQESNGVQFVAFFNNFRDLHSLRMNSSFIHWGLAGSTYTSRL